MAKRIKLASFIKLIRQGKNLIDYETDSTRDGCHVYKIFLLDMYADRNTVDSATDFDDLGWQHFCTPKDADYYGQWLNPMSFQFLNYAEGDWFLTECHDQEQFEREFHRMRSFHEATA